MHRNIRKIWGFRSGTPWKSGVALLYDGLCLAFLVISLMTPPLIEAGVRDALIMKLSSLVLFMWMLSPVIFLSDTPLRKNLPFFRDEQPLRSLVGIMIVSVLFLYLFTLVEGLHTPLYKAEFKAYITGAFDMFVQAGAGTP